MRMCVPVLVATIYDASCINATVLLLIFFELEMLLCTETMEINLKWYCNGTGSSVKN